MYAARYVAADHSDAVKRFAVKRALSGHKQAIVTSN
jgi:hypothetical protein